MFPNFKTKRIVKLNSKKEGFIQNNPEIINNLNKVSNIGNNKIKKQNHLYQIILFIIFSIFIIGFFIYKGYSDFKTDILVKNEIIIQIKKGDFSRDLSEKLNINNNYLRIYLKKNNPDFELIVGNFKIQENSNIEQILKNLKQPIIENEINITILEGWNIFDIDEYLSNKKLIEEGEYISYVQNLEKIYKLTEFFPFIKGIQTLEGFLYPDTYTVISNNFKINVFVIKQLENFENKVYKTILNNLDNETIIDVINLASIVEKEEKNINEKSSVAGILKKRLNEGWMIGADITVCYPHKLTANECKMVISKYINEKSEYNTRTMAGLPKTPIGNPSVETINATLNYKSTKYYFYLHDTVTGKIYYAKTNAEHEKNKRLYLK